MGQQQRPKGPNVGSKSPGQQNDTFGSSPQSRSANLQRHEATKGINSAK